MIPIFKKFIKVTFASCALFLACNSYAALSGLSALGVPKPKISAKCASLVGEWAERRVSIEQLWRVLSISLQSIVSQCQSQTPAEKMSYNLYKYDDGSIQTKQFIGCEDFKRRIGQIQYTFKVDYSDKIYQSKKMQFRAAKCSSALMAPTLNRDLPWRHAKTKASTPASSKVSSKVSSD